MIGEGAMGTVWAATDEVLLRRVAIKDIKYPPGTPAAEAAQLQHRLLREARAVAALSHPNVITVYDILTTPTGPVIVMELLHARSVAQIVRDQGRLTPARAATVGAAVAAALTAAHTVGTTHRDVKPANVLIGTHDNRVTLTDFGLARNSDEQTLTGAGLILGSPAYIAPEIAQGQPVGPTADAWSLGALLFYCVQGRPPFDQGTAIATLTSVVKDPVPPHPHSGALGEVITGLLAKTPTQRMPIDRALTIMKQIVAVPDGNPATIRRPAPSTRSDDATLPTMPGLRHHMDPGRNNPHRSPPGGAPARPEKVRTSTPDPDRPPPLQRHGHPDPPPARRNLWRRLRSQRPFVGGPSPFDHPDD
jgi:serine/threonine protein kinase